MSMVQVQPIRVSVRTDWFTGTPREILVDGRRIPVRRIAAVRREVAAFSVATGPRTIFEVVTQKGRLSLTFRHRARDWRIEGYDTDSPLHVAA
jgi:hypothetical protein